MSGWETFSHIWEFLSIPFMNVDDSKLNILFNFCVNTKKPDTAFSPSRLKSLNSIRLKFLAMILNEVNVIDINRFLTKGVLENCLVKSFRKPIYFGAFP